MMKLSGLWSRATPKVKWSLIALIHHEVFHIPLNCLYVNCAALPAFFGGSEGDLSGLGGEPNDFAALQSAEDHDAATKSQEDPEKNKFNDMTFGESLDDIPTEGLPGFFGGNESQQGSQTAGHQLKMQDSGNDDTGK